MNRAFKALSTISLFVSICFACASPDKQSEQLAKPSSTAGSVEVKKIDRFYSELAKLDKWYSTTKRMPADAAIYKDKIHALIKETEQ